MTTLTASWWRKRRDYFRFRAALLLKAALTALLSHLLRRRRYPWTAAPPAEVLVVLDLSLGLGDVLMISPALRHLAGGMRVRVLTHLPDFLEQTNMTWQRCPDASEWSRRVAEAVRDGVPLFVPRLGLRSLLTLLRQPHSAALTGLTAADRLLDTMAAGLGHPGHVHYTDGIVAALTAFCAAVGLPPPPLALPRLPPRRAAAAPSLAAGAPLVALAPWAHGESRRWPLDNLVRSIDLIHARQPQARFLLVGGAGEVAQGELVRAGVKHPERVDNHMGRHGLDETCALIAACDAMVACDNGPMHLAIGLEVPLLALFGCTAPETRVAGSRTRTLYDPSLCPTRRAPCHRPLVQNSVCPTGIECMGGLPPERIAETLLSLTSRPLSPARAELP